MRSHKKRNILNENLRTWVSKDFILNINLRYCYVSKLIGKFPEGKNVGDVAAKTNEQLIYGKYKLSRYNE